MKETFIRIARGALVIVPLTILALGYGVAVASLPSPYGFIVWMLPWVLLFFYFVGSFGRSSRARK